MFYYAHLQIMSSLLFTNYTMCYNFTQKKIPTFFYLLYTYKLLLFPEMLEAAEDPEVFEMTVAGLAI